MITAGIALANSWTTIFDGQRWNFEVKMVAHVNWTSENDKVLVDFVKNNEALYNVKCVDYRKAQLKQNLWNNIGKKLKKSGVYL